MLTRMTKESFAPKDAETIKSEILAETGLEYEGNEAIIDKLVAKGVKDEEFKASLHSDKTKHLTEKQAYAERMRKAGLDPETGEKLAANDAKSETPGMSLQDIRALNDVHDEDVEEVTDYAKRKGISIAEAKKSPIIQTYLKTRTEERKTAEVASTAATRRSSSGNSSDALIKKIDKQEEMSDDEMQSAAKAIVANLKGGK